MDEQEKNGNTAPPAQGNVGGLIAEVENKMSELMAWHKSQVAQFESDKAKFEAEMLLQREALKAEGEEQAKTLQANADEQEKTYQHKVQANEEAVAVQRKSLDDRMGEVEAKRIKLVELASKLRAQESAISREWGEVQKEREAVQKQAEAVAQMREQTQERAKAWLETTAAELSEPLKLTTQTPEDASEKQPADHHQEAA